MYAHLNNKMISFSFLSSFLHHLRRLVMRNPNSPTVAQVQQEPIPGLALAGEPTRAFVRSITDTPFGTGSVLNVHMIYDAVI